MFQVLRMVMLISCHIKLTHDANSNFFYIIFLSNIQRTTLNDIMYRVFRNIFMSYNNSIEVTAYCVTANKLIYCCFKATYLPIFSYYITNCFCKKYGFIIKYVLYFEILRYKIHYCCLQNQYT